MNQFFKTVHVFRRPEGFFNFGVINTPYGGITVPPASNLPLTASRSELGNTVLSILNSLPDKVTDINLATARLPFLAHLAEMGFKNPKAFEKKASLVAVHFDGCIYEVVAHEKDENGVFVAMVDEKLSPGLSAQELGEAVFAAFETLTVGD